MISTSLPSTRRQWVKSDCHTSLGAAASNRIQELRGRLRGSGTTRPAAPRMRRMVEVEGAGSSSRSRCQAMVAGPASRPPAVSSIRRATIRPRTWSGVRPGLVRGRRDLGSSPSRPPSRYRRSRRCRCPRLIPYSAAAAVTDNCDEMTLRTATRCFDMRGTVTHVPTHQSPIRCHLCPELRHYLASQLSLVRGDPRARNPRSTLPADRRQVHDLLLLTTNHPAAAEGLTKQEPGSCSTRPGAAREVTAPGSTTRIASSVPPLRVARLRMPRRLRRPPGGIRP